jgi:hypothetical protein
MPEKVTPHPSRETNQQREDRLERERKTRETKAREQAAKNREENKGSEQRPQKSGGKRSKREE